MIPYAGAAVPDTLARRICHEGAPLLPRALARRTCHVGGAVVATRACPPNLPRRSAAVATRVWLTRRGLLAVAPKLRRNERSPGAISVTIARPTCHAVVRAVSAAIARRFCHAAPRAVSATIPRRFCHAASTRNCLVMLWARTLHPNRVNLKPLPAHTTP